jgi:hypothetical protein
VPDDLSVIGFDGIALGEDLTPALTTIAQPNSDIGRHSVELLVQAMAGGTTLQADASLLLPTPSAMASRAHPRATLPSIDPRPLTPTSTPLQGASSCPSTFPASPASG